MSESESGSRLDELKRQWDEAQPLSAEAAKALWDKLRLEWNYNSNHIEGNTLTYGETELLLLFGKLKGNHELWEVEQMKAHDVAVNKIREWAAEERFLNEADIKGLNKLILVEPFWKSREGPTGEPLSHQVIPGEYKTQPNSVRLRSGEILEFAQPIDVPPKMCELLDWLNHNWAEGEIANLIAELHHRFTVIHPFDDGNGRVSRLVVNYLLMKRGYLPIYILSSDKAAYLDVLQRADGGDLEPFVDYLRNRVEWSLELGVRVVKGESIEEADDFSKRIEILEKRSANQDRVLDSSSFKSRDSVRELVDVFLSPFYDDLLTQAEAFGTMFGNISVNVTYSPGGSGRSWQEVIKWLGPSIEEYLFIAAFKESKLAVENALERYVEISFHFDNTSFTIFFEKETRVFFYDKLPNEEERKSLVKMCLKPLLDELEEVL